MQGKKESRRKNHSFSIIFFSLGLVTFIRILNAYPVTNPPKVPVLNEWNMHVILKYWYVDFVFALGHIITLSFRICLEDKFIKRTQKG